MPATLPITVGSSDCDPGGFQARGVQAFDIDGILLTWNGETWQALTSPQTRQMQALVSGAGNTASARIVPEVSIFQAELRTSTAPLTPDGANVTVAFSRLFAMATLQTSGLYAEVAHNTPGFAFVPGANRPMYAGSGGGVGVGVNQRDLTDAGWIKTNATAAKNVTGIDGTANAASSLTATAALATALFPVTASALARTFQAHIARRAGYGRVWITGDGGTSWTDVTAKVGPTFSRVSVATGVANPSFGFMLENSGDAINCDSMAGFGNAFPTSTAFLSRSDMQGQTLRYTGARKATANPAFSIEFNWFYDDTPSGSVVLSNAGANPVLTVLQSIGNQPPAVQLGLSGGTAYSGNPTIFVGTRKTTPGNVHKYKIVFVGGTVFSYLDGVHVGIYDRVTPITGTNPANFLDLDVLPGIGNYAADVQISDWLGRVVVGLGDSISNIESYRQAWLKALPGDSIFANKAISGNTVAEIRDRIAADLAIALPAGNTCYVVLWCGTNSLSLGNSPAATLAELQTAINNILAINSAAKIIIPTTFTYRTGGLAISAGAFTTAATTYNAGLSALTGVYKVVEMNDAESTASTFFLVDGIHPKGASYGSIVRKLAPWIV